MSKENGARLAEKRYRRLRSIGKNINKRKADIV
jgi:hypothetical protein